MKDLSAKIELSRRTAEITNSSYKLLATTIACLAQVEDHEKVIEFLIEILQVIKSGITINKELDNEEVPLEETEVKVSELESKYQCLRQTAKETLEKMI